MMSKLSSFNGERLKSSRMYRGYTLTELSKVIGVSKQALSLYENNNIKPELERVLRISSTLGFPYEFFFQKSTFDLKTDTTYFRALVSTSKKDRTAQSIKLEYLAQIYLVLNDYIEFPKLNIPKIEFQQSNVWDDFETQQNDILDEFETNEELEKLEEISQNIRSYWELGDGPIDDLRYILESNGIIVTSFESTSAKIDAFSQRTLVNKGEMYIVAISKSGQSIARSRFDMAHELGHILLHPWSEDIETIPREEFKARERQANTFAGAFLLPRDSFIKDVSMYPTTLEYYKHLKQKWNVSIAAMVYRACQLKVITTNQLQYLMRQMSKNKWREHEPNDVVFELHNNVLQSAIDILITNNIFTSSEFVTILSEVGLAMNSNEIEELLCLERGKLNYTKSMQSDIIQLRNIDKEILS
jgi:Zn-dependent peptidase ImmA (M78 family)/DNA-binding XRE family transcriptional regulator